MNDSDGSRLLSPDEFLARIRTRGIPGEDGTHPPCEHEWHRGGTVNGVPDVWCQWCGATKLENDR